MLGAGAKRSLMGFLSPNSVAKGGGADDPKRQKTASKGQCVDSPSVTEERGEGRRTKGIDMASIHETVMTRVNEKMQAFSGEDQSNPGMLIPALATAVSLAVGEVMRHVLVELDERYNNPPPPPQMEHAYSVMRQQAYELDNLKQYTRRESIRIAGVHKPEGETAQQVEEKALAILNSTGAAVVPDDIAAVHRAGKPVRGKQAILVKFVSRRKRNQVIEKKKALKEKKEYEGVFLNDDLTPLRARLLNFVKNTGKVERAWTRDGKIYAKKKLPPGLHLPEEQMRPVVIENPDDVWKHLGVVMTPRDLQALGLGYLIMGHLGDNGGDGNGGRTPTSNNYTVLAGASEGSQH